MKDIDTTVETKIRKYRDNMRISAYGTFLFGAWNILKCVLYLLMDKGYFNALYEMYDYPEEIWGLAMALIFILLGIDLLLRLLVSFAAIKESKGKKKGCGYVIFGVILLIIVYIPMLCADVYTTVQIDDVAMLIDSIVATIVDITSVYALFDLLYCSIRFKILSKQYAKLAERGGADNAG